MKFEELKASGNLPSPTGVALELLQMIQDENVNINEIARVIQADPVLTGRVLKIANSAFSGREEPTIAVKHSIVRLGLKVLSRLALTISVLESNRSGSCQAFEYDAFWKKSLLRALAMQSIATFGRIIAPEEAFTVGLVSEIGSLALAQVYPQEYNDILVSSPENLLEIEEQQFLIHHDQITLDILDDWGIPKLIIEAVQVYHHPNFKNIERNTPTEKLAAQLEVASLLAGDRELNFGSDSIMMSGLGISSDLYEQLRMQIFEEWHDWENLLAFKSENHQTRLDYQGTTSNNTPKSDDNSRFRLLLVDDDRSHLFIMASYLTSKGYLVATASNGKDALSQMILSKPNVAIIDYRMEPMDGLELCTALRSNNETQNIYIIFITADKDLSILPEAFSVGVNDFIYKPINQNELDARIIGAKQAILKQENRIDEQEIIRRHAFELAIAKRNMEKIATTDALTDLSNRRYALTRLDREWAYFLRSKYPLAILTLDLDFFKQINDNFGHGVGDLVLVHFAKILRQSIRIYDVACRMGGEEFIVIAPNTDYDNAYTLGTRICNMVEKIQPEELQLKRKVTVSIGIAIANSTIDLKGWSDTINRSDQALYDAKTSGRNMTKIFDDRA